MSPQWDRKGYVSESIDIVSDMVDVKAVAKAGYSDKPLSAKLGYKAGMRVAIIGMPDAVLPLVADVWPDLQHVQPADAEAVHLFTASSADVRELVTSVRECFTGGEMLWISWPKKTSGVATDITEDRLREWILASGLVDVKVCAVDATWSALKFMLRKELRVPG